MNEEVATVEMCNLDKGKDDSLVQSFRPLGLASQLLALPAGVLHLHVATDLCAFVGHRQVGGTRYRGPQMRENTGRPCGPVHATEHAKRDGRVPSG